MAMGFYLFEGFALRAFKGFRVSG